MPDRPVARRRPVALLTLATTLAWLACLLAGTLAAHAAVFNPAPATPDGAPGSLRDVITQANGNGENDTINLAAGNYDLTVASATQDNANAGGDLDLAADGGTTLTIAGAGLSSTTIRWPAFPLDRVLDVQPGATVILRDLTVFNGQAFDDGTAGALPEETDAVGGLVLMFDSNLTAENVQFTSGTLVAGSVGGNALQARGGVISVQIASLTLRNSEVVNGAAQGGGTSLNSGESGGPALGGGIYCADANLLLEGSTVRSNNAVGFSGADGADAPGNPGFPGGNGGDGLGGGLYAAGCSVVVRLSAFWDNTANGGQGGDGGDGFSGGDGGDAGVSTGGAIFIPSTNTPLQLIDSTFSDNRVFGGDGGNGGVGTSLAGGNGGDNEAGEGGAVYVVGDLVLVSSTIADNQTLAGTPGSGGAGAPPGSGGAAEVAAFGGLRVVGSVSGESTISADNTSADGFGGGSLDRSLFELVPSGIALGTNQFGVDPGLQPLANNGGPTFTHAILPGSPAHDQGSNSTGLPTDQRGIGFARTVGAATDVGAFEIQGVVGPAAIPTLGGWLQILLACGLALTGWAALRR